MNSDEWRSRVGVHIEYRRKQFDELSKREAARRAGFSEGVWRQLESGNRQVAPGVQLAPNPGKATQRGVARALLWPDDWLDRLLRGESAAAWEEPIGPMQPTDDDDGQLELLRTIVAAQTATGAALERIEAQLALLPTLLERQPAPPPPVSAGSTKRVRGAKQ